MSVATDTAESLLSGYGDALAECLFGPPEQVGERLVKTFLATWEDPELGPQFVELFRAACASDEGAAVLREFLSTGLFAHVARKLKTQSADLGEAAALLQLPPLHFNAAAGQIWGVVVLRHVLKIEPIASVPADALIDLLSPVIQRYLGSYSVPGSPGAR